MKKTLLMCMAVCASLTVAARDNYSHDEAVLPDPARALLDNDFKSEVSHIKIGRQFGHIRNYDVIMTDGTEISFDKHGVWNDVMVGADDEVPESILLPPIAQYLKAHCGDVNVTGIKKVDYGYEVDLSDGKDAQFSPKGKFIGYDD